MVYNDSKKMPKNAKKFQCIDCDFICSKESNWNKHILTRKHQNGMKMVGNDRKKCQKMPKNAEFICDCGKKYKWDSGLYRHRTACHIYLSGNNTIVTNNSEQSINEYDCENTNNLSDSTDTNTQININKMFAMFTQMMTQNQDFMKDVVGKVQGNYTNNSTNTTNNNNQFNINMFLNEQCKDAMNISDFIRSLPITAEHYENTKNNGLTDTLANMMVDGLNNMDIVERPIHCTDQERKVMYVKDNDKWERDNNHKIITKNVSDLAKLQRTMVKLWQEENPNFKTVENLQTDFTNILFNLFTSVEENKKELSKILKAVTDTTYLDEDMKQQLLTC